MKHNSKQYSFRRESSYTSAVSVLKENLAHFRDRGTDVHSMSIDLTKAFDRLNINFVIEELFKIRVSKIVIRIVSQMLTSFYVRDLFGKSLSSDFKVGNGTRQGGKLPPLLYSMYVNDVIGSISKCLIGYPLGYYRTNIFCYANDDGMMCSRNEGLQVLVE